MNTTCSSTFRSKLTGNKLENIGYTRLIAVTNVKIKRVDYDYKVGDKNTNPLGRYTPQAESIWRNPWTITTVHTIETIRIQCGTKSERINIRRVTPFSEELLI